MSLVSVFKYDHVTDTEIDIVSQCLSNPAVIKYLKLMAANEIQELLEVSAIGTDKEVILRAHSVVQGRLQILTTLLGIGEPKPNDTPTEE